MSHLDHLARSDRMRAEREIDSRIIAFWTGPHGDRAPSDANDILHELRRGPTSVSDLAMVTGLSMSRVRIALIWLRRKWKVEPSREHDGTWLVAAAKPTGGRQQ